jgi:MFS superfamily sulfate permease-like transporter
MTSPTSQPELVPIPKGNASGFVTYFKNDIVSGFLVFLIALPLCLGISLASGFPAIAGIFTAIVGAIVTTFISNSEMTIKGPAAGLIVIVAGCVSEFTAIGEASGFDASYAYRATLAVGVVAATLQIIFGIFKGGGLGDFFPLSAVHGMLAAIGVIIIVKQIPVALGVDGAKGEPFEMIQEIPRYFREMNPEVAAIGAVGIAVMFIWPLLQRQIKKLKMIPSPLVILLTTVPMGMFFQLSKPHSYEFNGSSYQLSEKYLIAMPDHAFGMFELFSIPEFSGLSHGFAWKWVFMFFVIGSLESLLSAKAVDLLDPFKRKTDMNRDLVAVGTANLVASMIGGLPMISEIVRSRANIDSGAKTRFADLWHGIFLLTCVALLPTYLHLIPKAALAAMLIYTGTRLAHPNEFRHMLHIGKDVLTIFVITLLAVLATDLLVGIAIGIAVKIGIHLFRGVPLASFWNPYLDAQQTSEDTVLVTASKSAIFSNWIRFRRRLVKYGIDQDMNVDLDLSNTVVVDHTVMQKLRELQGEFTEKNLKLTLLGLDSLEPLSSHPDATRRRRKLTPA